MSVGTVNAVAVETVGLGCRSSLLEGLKDIVGEILSILDTAADADKVVKDTDGLTLVPRDTSVGHAAGNLNQTLDTAETLGEGEDLCNLAEALSGSMATLNAEREHTTAEGVAVLLLGDMSVRVRVKAGVVDSDDQRRCLKSSGNSVGVAASLTSSQVQGLETAVSEPGVESGGDSTNGVLEEAQAGLELVAVEGSNTHNYITVAIDVLGDTVDDDIGTEVERVLDVGGEESVVDNDEDTMLVGLSNDGSDIDEAQCRVARSLNPDQASIGGDVLGDVDLDLRCESDLDTVGLCDLGEVTVCTSVDIGDGDDMAASSQTLENGGGGGGTGGESKSVLGVLESSNSGLEVGTVRVGGSRVLVLADGLANSGLGKSGRQRDRLDHGSGGGVMWSAGVDGESTEVVDGGRRTRWGGHGVRVERSGRHDCW